MVRLSVVVCTYNRPILLASCLQSLAGQAQRIYFLFEELGDKLDVFLG